MYKIGVYKNGQQIATEVFSSNKIGEVKQEFKRMWNATDFCPEGSDNQAESANKAWKHKHFSEDTNNVAVFKGGLHTNYTYQGCTSNQM